MNQRQDYWHNTTKKTAVLNPVDRISEILFGLIMVLTFTSSISLYNQNEEEVKGILWAALGCNVAWGLVDAIMYLMNLMTERKHAVTAIRSLQVMRKPEDARILLKEEIQPLLADLLSEEALDELAAKVKALPSPDNHNLLIAGDFKAALQIFLLVFLCTIPVALPFAFIAQLPLAMKISNGVAISMLFMGGYKLADYAGFNKFLTAALYTGIGVLLVFITMALGG